MTATTFNPLEVARDLESAGLDRRQAEAIAEGMRKAATADHAGHADLATKADLRAELAHHVTRGEFYRSLWLHAGAIVGMQIAVGVAIVQVLS